MMSFGSVEEGDVEAAGVNSRMLGLIFASMAMKPRRDRASGSDGMMAGS